MASTVKLGARVVPYDQIKFFKPLSDEDRARIAEKYGTDTSDRQIQATFADGSQKTFTTSLDDIKGQGVGLVNLGSDRHVIAASITSAEPFTKADAEAAAEKGYTIGQTFRSRVTLSGGRQVLSSAHPSQVMDRRERALGLGANA
ncbi:MAG: hypothetical protein AAFS01_05485 [Pseudomonadota bacterium]